MLGYYLYEYSEFTSIPNALKNLNGIVIAGATDGCTYSDLRLRLQLKKVEKASLSDNNDVVEITPGVGEAFNIWGPSPAPTRGIYDPIYIDSELTGGVTTYFMMIDTADDTYLPPRETGKYYIFYYTLYLKDTSDVDNVQFTQEQSEFNFILKVFNEGDFYQCLLSPYNYAVNLNLPGKIQ